MGRGNRGNSGSAGGGLRETAPKTSPAEMSGVSSFCKNDDQRLVLQIANDLQKKNKVVSLLDVVQEASSSIDEHDARDAVEQITEGLRWEDTRAPKPVGPLLRVENIGRTQMGIRPVSEDYMRRRAYLAESTVYGYSSYARAVSIRNSDLRASCQSPAEEALAEYLIEETPFDPALASRYYKASDVTESLGGDFSEEEIKGAMQSLAKKEVVDFADGEEAQVSLRESYQSAGPYSRAARRQAYLEEVGREKLEERDEEIARCNQMAQTMTQGTKEEAIVAYLSRENPRREDDTVPYSSLSSDLEPVMTSEEMRQALRDMVGRELLAAEKDEKGEYSFSLHPDLASL